MKHEIVCILRAGFNFLHTEGEDFAAKVTYHRWTPGKVQTHEDVLQELLIPRQPESAAAAEQALRDRGMGSFWKY